MPELFRKYSFFLMGWIVVLTILSGSASAEWLQISGEKGFSFIYVEGDSYGDEGLRFSQSLRLDLAGEFGKGYTLEGHLVDEANADAQLFFRVWGPKQGLQFGEGSLEAFSTGLTPWDGKFNGLSAYWTAERNDLRLAYANPTGMMHRETVVVRTGRNFVYLTVLPVVEETLKVYRAGRLLTETVDYRFDSFTGKIELLFFSEREISLDLEYQYSPGEVPGNRFYAVKEGYTWGAHTFGLELFGSQSRDRGEPILLGETAQIQQFGLNGLFYAWQGKRWNWDLEIWQSREEAGQNWDYLDNMEGSEVRTEAFTGSTNLRSWFGTTTGSAAFSLDQVSAAADPQHTRDGKSSLALDYRLQRSGDTVFVTHDFGTYRDFSLLSKLHWAWYLNGADLQIEVQVVTSENNYYSQRRQVSQTGWFDLDLVLDPAGWDVYGFPDLRQIRYVTVVIRSVSGDPSSGRLYQAPVMVTGKSSAEQRWSNRATAPGSDLDLRTVIDPDVPGESVDNQALELEYDLLPSGWASISYLPPVVIDLAGYRTVKLYIKSEDPVTLEVLTERSGKTYILGTVSVLGTGTWQEYSIGLECIPDRILERIEKLTFKISGGPGRGRLRLDAVRACERTAAAANAYKIQGKYQTGPLRNEITVSSYDPGFRELGRSYHATTRDIRNLTQYTTEQWQIQTDIGTYQKGDTTHGYPLQGNRATVEIVHDHTRVSLNILDEAAERGIAGVAGERSESVLAIRQQFQDWILDYQHQTIDDTLDGNESNTGDSLTARYQRQGWWIQSQLWQEESSGNILNRNRGSNLSFGLQRSESNRFRFQGGTVRADENGADSRSYFWQGDLSYQLVRDLIIQGTFRTSDTPEDRAGLVRDEENEIRLRYQPSLGWEVRMNYRTRNWSERDLGDSKQAAGRFSAGYRWAGGERIGVFYQDETLTSGTAYREGSRYGFDGEARIVKPWLTQWSAEWNTSDGVGLLTSTETMDYTYSFRNSYQRQRDRIYWGFWAEGVTRDGDRCRELFQSGWEMNTAGLSYGAKLDLGTSDWENEANFIWGSGGFIRLNRSVHQLQASLRYQTYAEYTWKVSLDYRFLQSEIYTLQFQGNCFQSLTGGHDLTLQVDLNIYLR